MARSAGVLLAMSRTILFVDRNFRPKDRGFRRALEAFLMSALDRAGKCLASLIEYHTGDRMVLSDFTDQCNGWLPDVIPSNLHLRLVRWRFGELHNRYILTDLGGIQFGQGLDEAGDTDQPEDDISLLSRDHAAQLLADFIGPMPKYTRADTEVVIRGRKIV
jgi:hypothetical protein